MCKYSFINFTTKPKFFSKKISTLPVRSLMMLLFFCFTSFSKSVFNLKSFYKNNFLIQYRYIFFLNSKLLKKIFF